MVVLSQDGQRLKMKINKVAGVKYRKWDVYRVAANGTIEKAPAYLVKEYYKANPKE